MTPAINAAKKAKVDHKIHEYKHDPKAESYGDEAAKVLNIEPSQVFKTLLVALNGDQKKLAVGVVPVSGQLDLKAMASALKVKKVVMANPEDAERATGYVVGGISPLGQKKRLPLVLDASASSFQTIFMSAGKRGLEIEMSSLDLLKLTAGVLAPIGKG
ncbi:MULTISPECIES: Cys-tRNA(Pro) deacylase [unclassified Neptuniibacter]|uniref:Cys-tRNA(Pro) deacylase n=1 Tax=unclassified Neptuniibacter TaxID=2630693 RepID=UPI000C65265D|nr:MULTISPECIES: Cys-tRNA(Pro) deacylase [unclassified Neptuniibacter]MAY41557.1 Cys-tRNA(Pro) deacylase [Oceanospirillaceae bacterium]|tara:strand:+ start:3471 stop:3947 length:477 start_codon:yes stop_codon:yes gene_type:complete